MTGLTVHIPVLETERLILRAPKAADFDAYAAFRASDRARVLGGPFSREVAFEQLCGIAGHWTLRGFGRWIVADRRTDEPLGVVGPFYPEGWPEPEIAWSVFDAAEGRGIAFEAARASLDYAYDTLGWTTAVSLIAPSNTRSSALAQRLAARIDGQQPNPTYGPLDIWRHVAPGDRR